ncbi:MAG: hypothetical protein ACLPXM_01455 [Terriglobales bacterium]
METLGCVLCGKALDKRIDKNGKPYFICDPCGTQFFVRRQEGVSRLDALMKKPAHSSPVGVPGSKALLAQIPSLREDAAELTNVCENMSDEDLDWLEDFQKRLIRALEKIEKVLARNPPN